MEKSIFFTSMPCNMISFSFEYITKILKSEAKDKFDWVIGVGRFLEQFYQGSLELLLFFTEY